MDPEAVVYPTLKDIANAAFSAFGNHVLSCPTCRTQTMKEAWCPEGLDLDAARRLFFAISNAKPRFG